MRPHGTKVLSLVLVAMPGALPIRVGKAALLLGDEPLTICSTHRYGADNGRSGTHVN